jgi:hypothetical protein
MHPAGLTAFDMDRMRDLKYNFQADTKRQNNNNFEHGGIFDRAENSGVNK